MCTIVASASMVVQPHRNALIQIGYEPEKFCYEGQTNLHDNDTITCRSYKALLQSHSEWRTQVRPIKWVAAISGMDCCSGIAAKRCAYFYSTYRENYLALFEINRLRLERKLCYQNASE
jgi:hypothetical protein